MLARVAQAGAPAQRRQQPFEMVERRLAPLGARAALRPARRRPARGAIAPTSHGAPTAARPIITARAPDCASIARASSSAAAIAVDDDRNADRGDDLARPPRQSASPL